MGVDFPHVFVELWKSSTFKRVPNQQAHLRISPRLNKTEHSTYQNQLSGNGSNVSPHPRTYHIFRSTDWRWSSVGGVNGPMNGDGRRLLAAAVV